MTITTDTDLQEFAAGCADLTADLTTLVTKAKADKSAAVALSVDDVLLIIDVISVATSSLE